MGNLKALYNNLHKTAFWICLVTSIVLITMSFILPPAGYIEPTVLGATGEIFAFATLGQVAYAIEKGKNVTVSKGDVNVTVGKQQKEQENKYEEYDT